MLKCRSRVRHIYVDVLGRRRLIQSGSRMWGKIRSKRGKYSRRRLSRAVRSDRQQVDSDNRAKEAINREWTQSCRGVSRQNLCGRWTLCSLRWCVPGIYCELTYQIRYETLISRETFRCHMMCDRSVGKARSSVYSNCFYLTFFFLEGVSSVEGKAAPWCFPPQESLHKQQDRLHLFIPFAYSELICSEDIPQH